MDRQPFRSHQAPTSTVGLPLSPLANNVQRTPSVAPLACYQQPVYSYTMPQTPPRTPTKGRLDDVMVDSSPSLPDAPFTIPCHANGPSRDSPTFFDSSSPFRASQSSPVLSTRTSRIPVARPRGCDSRPSSWRRSLASNGSSYASGRFGVPTARATRRDSINPLNRSSAQRCEDRRRDFFQGVMQRRDDSRMTMRRDEEKRRCFYREEVARRNRLDAIAPEHGDLLEDAYAVEEDGAYPSSIEEQDPWEEDLQWQESLATIDEEMERILESEQAAFEAQVALHDQTGASSPDTGTYDDVDEDFDNELVRVMEAEMAKMHVS